MKQCLQSVNHKQSPIQMTQNNKHNKWPEILVFQPKLLRRTPTKIHRERRRRRQQEAVRKTQRTSLSIAKAVSSTQRPQTCTEAATKYYNYTANGAHEEREHRPATLTVYSKIVFDATIGSNSYTICTMHVKNISFQRTDDSLSAFTPWAALAFTVSFILHWTVYNTDNVRHVGKRYICKQSPYKIFVYNFYYI